MTHRHWDIFCTVIDNYGDIGVTWRLARRLAHDCGREVRLWVDDLDSFARIAPELDPALPQQTLAGIQIRRWPQADFPEDIIPGDVVVEAFGCRLPNRFEEAMAARPAKPVWINLEYLSAEDWTRGCHKLPSPHPQLPLTKHFFFPGFDAASGGLICEDGLIAAREAWQADEEAQRDYWRRRNVPALADHEWKASLFCYENPAAARLLQAWADGPQPVRCLVPEGKAQAAVSGLFDHPLQVGEHAQLGRLTVDVLPMSDQDDYDRLLWSCDFNCVRGEDSLARSQWAARPMLWHIYPQDDEAHIAKLQAFLDQYCAGLPDEAAAAIRELNLAWNQDGDIATAWRNAARWLPAWRRHAANWQQQLLEGGDLAHRLLQFVAEVSEIG
ncbi:elongation factor P maturation arginine rhamnosyltransferase EarP [Chromobacterium phragmitis]|uniref:elongation factor P maturation arginine rhamnosyltransferase EarP n=1 Tax=Chromobacterium amazonense TaxID=1382803 RepID=UPI0021B70D79|nr:elongation factor P maturation arginine rhamnosyltransferase EarP [Chromobacterium amazonense]MBM2883244.1 elongation factor P maturation arginine rhamnosyltransferase EarP [Chromobacterium amazonense]MDE1712733.1 elongation factor P maturation arginine rhamnosyltransferase EarP [Chromobacterium amazonense]